MKIYWTSFLLVCILAILSNCKSDSSNASKPILFPNNDSELTLLMREMYDYYEGLKSDIENGKVPSKIREFSEIHSAVATQPAKSESPLYKAMSTVYIESAKKLNSTNSNMPEVFNLMIDNCMKIEEIEEIVNC